MNPRRSPWLVLAGVLAAVFAGCDEDKSTGVLRQSAPTACFVVLPDSGSIATTFLLDVSCCADEEDPLSALQVRWDWESDGNWDTEYTVARTESLQYGTPGTKIITLQVRDTDGKLDVETQAVTVSGGGRPPEVFVLVQPNTFTMGSPQDELCREGEHEAQHTVTLARLFHVSTTEVTQAQWQAVMGWNDAHFRGWNLPVENVTWFDAVNYCYRRSLAEGRVPAYEIANASYEGSHIVSATVTWNQNTDGYRLLTEAEWECVARAGTMTACYSGALSECTFGSEPSLAPVGWYYWNAGAHTRDVATKTPNAWGLHDVHGNVYEWCWDWYGSYGDSVMDPIGPSFGYARIKRGGAWTSGAADCRSAARSTLNPGGHEAHVGLRLARTEYGGDTPPTACFFVSADSGGTTTIFEVDASCCTDEEDAVDALWVRWDWENDGVWDTEYSQTKTASHVYGYTGTKTLALEVRDTQGMTATTTQTVQVGSCPYLYSFNGRGFVLDAEAFSGAIMRARQATDGCRLEHLVPVDGACRLRLANRLPESQFVDCLGVIAIDHPSGTDVLPSVPDRFHTIRDAQVPLSATDYDDRVVTGLVAARDSRWWISDPTGRDPKKPADWRDGLVVRFRRPAGVDHAKLICTIRNTSELVEMERHLLSLYGWALHLWYAELNAFAAPRQEFEEFLQREVGLRADLWTGSDWQPVACLPFAGPAVARSVVVPLDLTLAEPGVMRIRLESTPGLWMVDRVQADFTPDLPVSVTPLSMRTAIDRAGRDVRAELAAIDGTYYRLERDDEAEIMFGALPDRPAGERSYAMLCTGYYVSDIHPSSWPRWALLSRLGREPGAFSAYAIETLNRWRGRADLEAAAAAPPPGVGR